MYNTYQVAGHRFGVSGERLCRAVESIGGFTPFLAEEGEVLADREGGFGSTGSN